MNNPRQCSGCVACCKLEFHGKPGGGKVGVPCRHAVAGVGCQIYHKWRLAICREYICPWLEGITRTRPDDLGALVYWNPLSCFGGYATVYVILEPRMSFSQRVRSEARRLARWLANEHGTIEFTIDIFSPDDGSHEEFWEVRRGRIIRTDWLS